MTLKRTLVEEIALRKGIGGRDYREHSYPHSAHSCVHIPLQPVYPCISLYSTHYKVHFTSIQHQYDNLFAMFPGSLKHSMEVASEPGASSWLSAIPIQEYGVVLHKGDFRDALCLRYGWQKCLLPSSCVCGQSFTAEHAVNCPCGEFPSISHNELRDITASLLTEVCHAVGTEPCLQPLSGKQLKYKTANDADEARLEQWD